MSRPSDPVPWLRVLLPLVLATCARSQVVVQWDHDVQIPAPERLVLGRAHRDPNGGWYLTGSRAVFHQQPGYPGIYLSNQPVLLRTDAQGLPIGAQDLAPAGVNPNVPVIAVASTGGVFAALTGSAASMLALDAGGAQQWSVSTPAAMTDVADVGFAPNGDVLAGGGRSFGPPSSSVAGWSSAGAPTFFQSAPLPQNAATLSAISADGRVAVAAGNYFTPLTVSVYGPDGTLAWSSTGPSLVELTALAIAPSGVVVAAGNQMSMTTSGRKAFVTSWSATGTPRGSYTENGFVLSRLNGVAVSADGELAAVGDAFTALPGRPDGLLLSFDSSGARRWTRTWRANAGDLDDVLQAVAYRASGELIAGGVTHLIATDSDMLRQGAPAITCWTREGLLAWNHVAPSLHNNEECTGIEESGDGSIVYTSRSTTYMPSSPEPAGGRFLSIRPRSIAFCFGDGSGTACPCANDSAPGSGQGCRSSLGAGAVLAALGNPSIAADALLLRASGMPATSTVLYFQGTTRVNGGAGAVFGDGKRCAGGTVVRLGSRTNSAGASQYPSAGDPPVHVRGSVAAGDVRTYQGWYRNSATFCTPSTFNLTNGVEVTWGA